MKSSQWDQCQSLKDRVQTSKKGFCFFAGRDFHALSTLYVSLKNKETEEMKL